jgi:hypothetical protein
MKGCGILDLLSNYQLLNKDYNAQSSLVGWFVGQFVLSLETNLTVLQRAIIIIIIIIIIILIIISGYWRVFPREASGRGVKVTNSPPPSVVLKMSGATPSLPRTSTWRGA